MRGRGTIAILKVCEQISEALGDDFLDWCCRGIDFEKDPKDVTVAIPFHDLQDRVGDCQQLSALTRIALQSIWDERFLGCTIDDLFPAEWLRSIQKKQGKGKKPTLP